MNPRFLNVCHPSRWIAAAITLATAGGCTVGPDYQKPQTATLDEWGELATASTRSAATRSATQPSTAPPIVQWWTVFGDRQLDSLIERAVKGNIDLRRAQARVREARAQRDVIGADAYPNVNFDGSYFHSRAPAGAFGGVGTSTGSATASGGGAAGGAGGGSTSTGSTSTVGAFPGEFDFYRLGFDASWEIDVFGGVRRNIEAARADLQAANEDRRDVLVTLLGDVARYYINLRGYQRQLAIAQKNLDAQKETLALTQTLLRIGRGTDLDVARAQAQVSSTESQIPTFEAAVRQTMHQLSVLVGMNPMALAAELEEAKKIPAPPEETAVGVPAQLLRRRPDIRRAERQLAAATARVGVATADLYPKFSLTGSFGNEETRPKNLFNYASRFYSIGPAVSWPIFDAGRIRATIRVRSAQQEQALATYESAVLTAEREVEDALVAYAKEEIRRRTLVAAVAANQKAVDLAKQLNEAGRIAFLDVLQAQRDLLTSEDALVQSERSVSTDLVSLYKALGGGWEAIDGNAADPATTEPTEWTNRFPRRYSGVMKSTVDQIRARFDADVERFSNLQVGQAATVDSPLAMSLIAKAAAVTTPHARHALDVGCGAGNYTLKLLEHLPKLDATLVDLSEPMLQRAHQRVSAATTGKVTTAQSDIRQLALPAAGFDIILAASVLHHLRSDDEWRSVFMAFHRALRPGGSIWIFDLIESSIPAVQELMRSRYGEYLTAMKDEKYRDQVFAYVEQEDTPKPLMFQLDLLREVGFATVEILHKNVCFAAFGAVKDFS